jgi:hypothetical protein
MDRKNQPMQEWVFFFLSAQTSSLSAAAGGESVFTGLSQRI